MGSMKARNLTLNGSYRRGGKNNQDHELGIPELALWRAVVKQTIDDLRPAQLNRRTITAQRQAIGWVFGGYEEFEWICINGGFDPEYIREIARNAARPFSLWPRRRKYTKRTVN